MKKNIIKLLVFLLSFSTFLHAKVLDDNYYFGISISKYDKVDRDKIRSVVDRISKEFGLITKREVKAKFIENIDVLVKDFIEDSKCNSFITYTGYYLRYKDILRKNSKYFFTFQGSKDFNQYILIANKNSHIKNLKDIKNKKFAYFNKSDNNYSQWLDYLTLKEFKEPYKKVVVLKKEDRKDSTLILEVFFNKADFTVVRKNVYEDMLLLNPSIKNEVTVIKESKPIFLYGVGAFHNKASKELISGFENKLIKNDSFTHEYTQLFKILDDVKIKKLDLKDLVKLDEFYDEYIRLKNKYK